MSEDLDNEVQAIQSIYGDKALEETDGFGIYNLAVPATDVSLRISFPSDYPKSSPEILGTGTTGEKTKKGFGKYVVETARRILQKVFIPSSVCLFDLLQELDLALTELSEDNDTLSSEHDQVNFPELQGTPNPPTRRSFEEEPEWTISRTVTEKRSTFLARACSVKSPTQAKTFVVHLLDTDKRAAKATHNIIAYRIRAPASCDSTSTIVYQDCDDDGETAAGSRLLHLLQVMDVWEVLVVVSRWFGGVKLGSDRFSLINNVAREAVVEGGWTASRITKT